MQAAPGTSARSWRDTTAVVVAAFAGVHGLPTTGWRRPESGNVAVVWLHDTAGVVVKVHPPGVDVAVLEQRIVVAAAARAGGACVYQGGLGGAAGPFQVGSWTVTVWELLDPVLATPFGLGQALASLHTSTAARQAAASVGLPVARHVTAATRWARYMGLLDRAESDILAPWIEWADTAARARVDGSVVHADVNVHNALGGDMAVLIDVDALGVAWAASDVAAARNRFAPGDWADFAAGYGNLPADIDESALIIRIANSALWDLQGRSEDGPASAAAQRFAGHLAVFAATVPPGMG